MGWDGMDRGRRLPQWLGIYPSGQADATQKHWEDRDKSNDREDGMHTASSIFEPASLPTFSPNFSALLPRGSFSRALSASTVKETSQHSHIETLKQ
jgi:hypothetical protein